MNILFGSLEKQRNRNVRNQPLLAPTHPGQVKNIVEVVSTWAWYIQTYEIVKQKLLYIRSKLFWGCLNGEHFVLDVFP